MLVSNNGPAGVSTKVLLATTLPILITQVLFDMDGTELQASELLALTQLMIKSTLSVKYNGAQYSYPGGVKSIPRLKAQMAEEVEPA